MTTIRIEDIHDISIDTSRYEVEIDIKDIRGSTIRVELKKDDAELLNERLHKALNKL
jgi:hypothetical protein